MKNYGEDTRNEVFHEYERKGARQRVYDVIKEYQPVSDQDISRILDIPINRVTGRRHELVEQGLVVDGGKIKQNGRTVHVWETNTQMRLI